MDENSTNPTDSHATTLPAIFENLDSKYKILCESVWKNSEVTIDAKFEALDTLFADLESDVRREYRAWRFSQSKNAIPEFIAKEDDIMKRILLSLWNEANDLGALAREMARLEASLSQHELYQKWLVIEGLESTCMMRDKTPSRVTDISASAKYSALKWPNSTKPDEKLVNLADMLISLLLNYESNECIDDVLVYLLVHFKSIEYKKKLLDGQINLIKPILEFITARIASNKIDKLLEACWSLLVTLTDECPKNSALFVQFNGISVFQVCTQIFGTKSTTDLKNTYSTMLIVLSNIAEEEQLRKFMLNDLLIDQMMYELNSNSQVNNVTFNVIGILSKLLAEGREQWHLKRHTWQLVSDKVIRTLDSWRNLSVVTVNELRELYGIAFRTLMPFIKMLEAKHSPASVYYSTWLFHILLIINITKYKPMMIEEGAVPILRNLLEIHNSETSIHQLASNMLEKL